LILRLLRSDLVNLFPAIHIELKAAEGHFIHSGFQCQQFFAGGRALFDLLTELLSQNFFKRKMKIIALAGEKSWTALILMISSREELSFSESMP